MILVNLKHFKGQRDVEHDSKSTEINGNHSSDFNRLWNKPLIHSYDRYTGMSREFLFKHVLYRVNGKSVQHMPSMQFLKVKYAVKSKQISLRTMKYIAPQQDLFPDQT